MSNQLILKPVVVRTERGLTIAGRHLTLYQIMDCLKSGISPGVICDRFRLTIRQITHAMEYIENNHDEVEAEYQLALKIAEDK